MNNTIYNEMMVHVPVCTHKTSNNVLIISDNADPLQNELARHRDVNVTTISACDALDALRDIEQDSFDVVLNEADTDATTLAHISRVLNDNGLLSSTHPSLNDVEANTTLMKTLGRDFKIIMPYRIAGDDTLLLASKEYHPTADIILHRTDLLEGQEYYNCDIHPAAFAMGNNIRKTYLGIIKN